MGKCAHRLCRLCHPERRARSARSRRISRTANACSGGDASGPGGARRPAGPAESGPRRTRERPSAAGALRPAAIGAGFVRLASGRTRVRPAGAYRLNAGALPCAPPPQRRARGQKTAAREDAGGGRLQVRARSRRGDAPGASPTSQWHKRGFLHERPVGAPEIGNKTAGQRVDLLRHHCGDRESTNESYPISASATRNP